MKRTSVCFSWIKRVLRLPTPAVATLTRERDALRAEHKRLSSELADSFGSVPIGDFTHVVKIFTEDGRIGFRSTLPPTEDPNAR